MRRAGSYHGPTPEAAFLLAAAVPVDFCAPGSLRRYAPLTENPNGRSDREHVFHSNHDATLTMFFDRGQDLIPEPGNAVGLHGFPAGRWATSTQTKLRHGKYWSSRLVAEVIAESLGLSDTRRIADHSVAETHPSDDSHALAERRLSVRRLTRRLL